MTKIKIKAYDNRCMNCGGTVELDECPIVYGDETQRVVFGIGKNTIEFVGVPEFGLCSRDCDEAFQSRIDAVLGNPDLIHEEDEPRTWEIEYIFVV